MSELLKRSIVQYRQIIEHARQLDGLLVSGTPEQLQLYIARLQELKSEAGLNDQELLAEVGRDSRRWQDDPLYQQRLQLLEQIVEMNDLLLPKIRGMMSVTAAELSQVKEGKTAVAGYHQKPVRNKKSVRGVG